MSPFPHFFPLTYHFFGLTSKYKAGFLEEIYICFKYLDISYSEAMKMPTYERRFFIGLAKNAKEKQDEENQEASTTTNGGKGSRKRTVTGDALKTQINNNIIPN